MKKVILKIIIVLVVNCNCFAQINSSEANYYTIKASNTNYYLDMQDGINHTNNSITKMSARGTSEAQIWKIEPISAGNFKITNAVTGLSLDGSCANSANACNVSTKSYTNSTWQTWQIIRTNGFYKIKLAFNNKKISSKNFEAVTLNENDSFNQLFEIIPSNKLIKTNKFTDLRGNQTTYKNQTKPISDRGGCTYFASIAALEAAYKKRGHGEIDLSEEFMAIASKMYYLHPKWNEITDAKYRESQFAGTQGGGSISILSSGLKIPLEAEVPYGSYNLAENWSSTIQKECNDFNFKTLEKFSTLNNAKYYGVSEFVEIKNITAENLENALKNGYEIKTGIAAHCILIVGFDITDPLNKRFIIKDSYNQQGLECYKKLQYLSYNEISNFFNAEYITAVITPNKWEEQKYIGRWKLNYAGWEGTLDIHKIPGIMNNFLEMPEYITINGGKIKDQRIGIFYDHNNVAHRVNGSFIKVGNEITLMFFIDNSKPNFRWDETTGRKFTYKINAEGNQMIGSHIDLDGRKFEGTAKKVATSIILNTNDVKIINTKLNNLKKN